MKLRALGFSHKDLNFLKSYLGDRHISTKYNSTLSNSELVNCGVPQGSIIGPLLFSLFINDLPLCLECDCAMFADDITVIVSDTNHNDLVVKCDSILTKLKLWSNENKLLINSSKTKFFSFNTSVDLYYDNVRLEMVDECKLLGIVLDVKLSWSPHILSLIKKLRYLLIIFYKIRNSLNNRAKLILFNSFVMSLISYSSIFFCNSTKKNISKLISVYNKLHRCLFGFNCSIVNFDTFCKYIKYKFLFNLLFNDDSPMYVRKLFLKSFKTNYDKNRFILPKCPLKRFSLTFSLMQFFNSLPPSFKQPGKFIDKTKFYNLFNNVD